MVIAAYGTIFGPRLISKDLINQNWTYLSRPSARKELVWKTFCLRCEGELNVVQKARSESTGISQSGCSILAPSRLPEFIINALPNRPRPLRKLYWQRDAYALLRGKSRITLLYEVGTKSGEPGNVVARNDI